MSFKPSIIFLGIFSSHLSLFAATTAQGPIGTEINGTSSSGEIVLSTTTKDADVERDPSIAPEEKKIPLVESKPEEGSVKREVAEEESVYPEAPAKRSVVESESADTHSSSPNLPIVKSSKSKDVPAKPSRSGPPPSGPSIGQKLQKEEALKHLAERVVELFACVPTFREPDYSTQSWYLVDTLKAWNNAVAESVFDSSEEFVDLKALFQSQANEALQKRNPSLVGNPAVLNYIQSVSLAADNIYKSASSSKRVSSSFSHATKLVQNSSRLNSKNAFQYLKSAHTSTVSQHKKSDCTQLGKDFFSTPSFAVPRSGLMTHKNSDRPKFVVDAKKIENKHLQYDAKINAAYPRSKFVTSQLPIATAKNMKKLGYYSAGQYRAARPHVIGNILKATNRLKDKGIYMGVGDINQLGTKDQEKVKTPGFTGRDHGTRATLMTQDSKGNPTSCEKLEAPCYDRSKTLTMLKAVIDSDPDNIKKIETNDEELQKELSDYLVSVHGYKRISANWIIRKNKEYSNVITYEWYQ